MKHFLVLSITLIFISCNSASEPEEDLFEPCTADYDLLDSEGEFPELVFQTDWPFDTLGTIVQSLFEEDLCARCDRQSVCVKVPYDYDTIQLKIEFPFDQPCCPKCPLAIPDRNYFTILINDHDMILAEGSLAHLDELDSMITQYWTESENSISRFSIQWKSGATREFINQTLNVIAKNYLARIETLYEKELCEFSQKEIETIKTESPLNIQFSTCFDEIENLHEEN